MFSGRSYDRREGGFHESQLNRKISMRLPGLIEWIIILAVLLFVCGLAARLLRQRHKDQDHEE